MSGICGVCRPGAEVSKACLDPMLHGLALTDEKDFQGSALGSIAFGVARRWSFQEIASMDGVSLALDADLLNRRDIEDHLQANGIDVSRTSLPGMLIRLYQADGPSFVKRLEGGFALAVWEEKNRRLLLATDPLGIKTLYWKLTNDQLLFASHVGAIRAASGEVKISSAAIAQFLLFSVVPGPLTIYQGVEKLEPGILLIYERHQIRRERYWDVSYSERNDRTTKDWAKDVREQIRAAVHRHFQDCEAGQTGAYLSGGTDSSSVVAFMSQRFPNVNTFSISFPETSYNEIGFARTTASCFKTNHRERCLTPKDALDAIPRIMSYYDQPFANSSALASYYCALLARESGVDTLLAGDGGDELFAGNERYSSDRRFALYHSVPLWIRRSLLEPTARLLPSSDGWLSLPRKYIRRANIPNPCRVFSYSVFLSAEPLDIFETEFLREAPPEHWMKSAEHHFHSVTAASELNRLMYLDLKIILADNDLRKVSGTAELAGVRVRYPLLDRDLAEFSASVPTRLKLRGFQKRYIFKKAMEGILPSRVLFKKKHGFGVPIGIWFLQDQGLKALVQDVLNDPRTRQRGYFRKDFYDRIVQLHREDHAAFYGEVIWYMVALELWHREHFERRLTGSGHAN